MSKTVKLAISIFVGADIFVLAYLLLSQLRLALFGTGDIPGGGSALDMALFLLPLFIGYVSGDRLYHFLTYNERRRAKQNAAQNLPPQTEAGSSVVEPAQTNAAIWQDADWDDETTPETKAPYEYSQNVKQN